MIGASATWLVLAICVQPAIFEELFFRYLTLGHLRSVTGVHGAVWVSSLIFGLAHLGVPLSIPMLVVVGVVLGYARVWSGSLLLPMLMHAAHNLVIVYLETQR
jgi:membrane protease YdiL (CAAX protease family)